MRPLLALFVVLALLVGSAAHLHETESQGACTACQLQRTTPDAPPPLVPADEPPAVDVAAPTVVVAAPPSLLPPLTHAPKTSPPRV
jgi:hypothetical protein